MKITQTNGNATNNISGSRLRIRADDGKLIDEFCVPTRNAKKHIDMYPNGMYGTRYYDAVHACLAYEAPKGTIPDDIVVKPSTRIMARDREK